MDNDINFGDTFYATCHKCKRKFMVRNGDTPQAAFQRHLEIAKIEHAYIADSERVAINDLSNREWESVLIRKVIPFRQKEV